MDTLPSSRHSNPSPSSNRPRPARSPSPSSADPTKIRAYAACKSCRIKKIKCLPGPGPSNPASGPGQCAQCTQAGIECTYPPTRDRAAYSRQYVQNLESRVASLELGWNRVVPLLETFERDHGIRPDMHAVRRVVPDPSLEDGHGGDDGDTLDEEDGKPSTEMEDGGQITQDERGNYRWIGSSNTLSLLESFHHSPSGGRHSSDAASPLERPAIEQHGSNPYFGPVAGSGVVKALPGVEEVVYPPPQRAEEMVHAYFREVHPCLPVLCEWQFRAEMGRLMDRRSRGDIEAIRSGFVSVLFAVFALGERVLVTSHAWQRERARAQEGKGKGQSETVLPGEAEAGVIWYERAQILYYTALKDVDVNQVQCLTLMAAFQASVNAMPMAWLLAGQAMRVAQDLGLHRSSAHMRLSFVDKQIRSRCWWAIYGLDRLVSISLGRPLGVDDQDIDVAYPAEIDDVRLLQLAENGHSSPHIPQESADATMSGFLALTKLCKLAGRVALLLYRPSNGRSTADPQWAVSQQSTINKLDKLLREWLATEVPAKYKDPSSLRSVQLLSAVLSNSYFAVLITLHRNFLPPNPDFPRPKPPLSSQSLSHCVDAARSVIHIAAQQRVLVPPSHHLAVACQYLWSSAIILLLCEVQARDQVIIEAVGSQVDSCKRSLQALEPVWPGSRKLKELLHDVETRAKQVVHATGRPSLPKKRKTSSQSAEALERKHRMGPPQPRQAHPAARSAPSAGLLGPTTPGGRPQIQTSDTRTNFPHEEDYSCPPYSAPVMSTYPAQPHATMDTSQMSLQPMDFSFDIGGVNFNGLEMLQGFASVDAASFWDSLTNDSFGGLARGQTPQPLPGGSNSFLVSNPPTPGSASGPSPKQQQQHNQGQQWLMSSPSAPSVGTSGVGALGPQEFWSQVSGGTFDWNADPSVPFNI